MFPQTEEIILLQTYYHLFFFYFEETITQKNGETVNEDGDFFHVSHL